MSSPQSLERYLKMGLPSNQSAFLWGPRKAGKSTYLKSNFPEAAYYDLLDSQTYLRFLQAPHLLREEIAVLPTPQRNQPILIDEFQRLPELLSEIHFMIENFKPISFILCGSSVRKLKRTGANLLGGRAWRYSFFPLVFPELENFDLLHIFQTGLIPSHYLFPERSIKSIKAYVADYLTHEIQHEGAVRNLAAFARFLDTMPYSHAEVINFSNIARDCAIDAKTVKEYFHILIDMLLGFFLYPYFPRDGRGNIVAHPKFYLFDVGVANHMAKCNISELKGKQAGKSLEHYLFYELKAYQSLEDLDFQISYWRTRSGSEVDFILGDGAVAIESKLTNLVQKRDIQGLLSFHKTCPDAILHVVSLEPRRRLMIFQEKEVHIWPLRDFLDALWCGLIIK